MGIKLTHDFVIDTLVKIKRYHNVDPTLLNRLRIMSECLGKSDMIKFNEETDKFEFNSILKNGIDGFRLYNSSPVSNAKSLNIPTLKKIASNYINETIDKIIILEDLESDGSILEANAELMTINDINNSNIVKRALKHSNNMAITELKSSITNTLELIMNNSDKSSLDNDNSWNINCYIGSEDARLLTDPPIDLRH